MAISLCIAHCVVAILRNELSDSDKQKSFEQAGNRLRFYSIVRTFDKRLCYNADE